VAAIDEAGNIGENQWGDTVKVDLKVPRIKHIEVKPSDSGAAGAGQQSYGAGATGAAPLGNFLDSQPTSKPTPSPYNASDRDFRNPKR